MKKVASLVGRELKWNQPSTFKQEFELRVGDEIAATLQYKSSFGSFATGKSADGCWTFKRVGFIWTRVTIRRCDSETEVASFKNNTWKGGGTLEIPSGETYRGTTNLWQSKFQFQTESETPLIEFKNSGVMHRSSIVNVLREAADLPELPWMVMLGWYVIVMMQRESDAGGAAAAAAG